MESMLFVPTDEDEDDTLGCSTFLFERQNWSDAKHKVAGKLARPIAGKVAGRRAKRGCTGWWWSAWSVKGVAGVEGTWIEWGLTKV